MRRLNQACVLRRFSRRILVYQNASRSVPIVLNAFATVILLKQRRPHSDLTAIKASPPVMQPAAALFIMHSVFRDILSLL
jgi:hypothetical protein